MNQEKFGKLIKDIRKKNNLTQKDLAEKYHVTYQAVSKWENGINMPDISLIKQISDDFAVSIDDMVDGEYIKKSNRKNLIIIILIILLITSLTIFMIFNSSNNFEFKTLSTTCNNFNISGSISYNSNKSYIYISNIEYCGGDDNKIYSNIECSLYENNNDTNTKITSCSNNNQNMKLEDFLKDVNFMVDNYSKTCKEYTENSLFLEIEAKDQEGNISAYKIPLSLKANCSKE